MGQGLLSGKQAPTAEAISSAAMGPSGRREGESRWKPYVAKERGAGAGGQASLGLAWSHNSPGLFNQPQVSGQAYCPP
jgi:hypothetical protein